MLSTLVKRCKQRVSSTSLSFQPIALRLQVQRFLFQATCPVENIRITILSPIIKIKVTPNHMIQTTPRNTGLSKNQLSSNGAPIIAAIVATKASPQQTFASLICCVLTSNFPMRDRISAIAPKTRMLPNSHALPHGKPNNQPVLQRRADDVKKQHRHEEIEQQRAWKANRKDRFRLKLFHN